MEAPEEFALDDPKQNIDSERDVERRRDDALRRALATPPKPHKPSDAGERQKKATPAKRA